MDDQLNPSAPPLTDADFEGMDLIQGMANEVFEALDVPEQQEIIVPEQGDLVPEQQGVLVVQSNELQIPEAARAALDEARNGVATLIHLHADALLRHRHQLSQLTPDPIDTRGVLNR
eukprot:108902-Prymnesium_polylepis.4